MMSDTVNKSFDSNLDYLVLGSTGMLGQALLKEIRKQNKTVMGIARHNADICLDVTNEMQLLETISGLMPKNIINAVSIVDLAYCEEHPVQSYLSNAYVSRVLADYCAVKSCKYIYISTDHYYTGGVDFKHTETSPVNLCNEYSITKYLGEKLSETNEDSLIVRTNIVGFRGNEKSPTFVEWVLQTLVGEEQMNLYNDVYVSSIDVDSFSKSLLDLIEKDPKGIINLASSDVSTKAQFIQALANRLNLSLDNTTITLNTMGNEGENLIRNESLGLDVSKAEKILGYNLPGLSDVIDSLATEYLNRV